MNKLAASKHKEARRLSTRRVQLVARPTLDAWEARRLEQVSATFRVTPDEFATVAFSRLLALGDVDLRETLSDGSHD